MLHQSSNKSIENVLDKEIQMFQVEKIDYERKAKIYSHLVKKNLRGLKWMNPLNLLRASRNYLCEFWYQEKIIANDKIILILN